MSILKTLEDSINQKEDELAELHKAYDIIRRLSMPPAQSAPTPAPLPADIPVQTREVAPSTATGQPAQVAVPPKPAYQGPLCGACQGKMYQTYRTMPSGAMVSLFKCNDGGCGNEIYN